MAVIGLGANYENEDVTEQFVSRGLACIGWTPEEAPPAHSILRGAQIGDIVYLKSFNPSVGLTIKAVGVVTGDEVRKEPGLGWGVPVRWRWRGTDRVGKIEDRWPARTVTIYVEHHPEIQLRVVDLLIGK